MKDKSLRKSILLLCCIFVMIISSCLTTDPENTSNCCEFLQDRKHWYKYAQKSYAKWKIPVYVQLAIINQESSFKRHAKPRRTKLLGFIPWTRISSAYGYAQALDSTWEWYQNKTGNDLAQRNDFADITDFIGWYGSMSKQLVGIKNDDAYNLYLAYHEGHTGFVNKSYLKKKWLKRVARKVQMQAKIYRRQLEQCEKSLIKNKFLGLF